ncbi:apolipoprotein N-acyltransferase [Geothermobacter hydrogeniphilus]|uniref:Apolipoprotein N-acyltransferase n=1 Tax=Geothermobacter hydrogeniphilus TaxID=1969733 RepID=A0A2K2HCF9_9BACT|nr:apolipoprotein N-acyltransferase [Geothermobacter hydrogeniphilus]PNU20909.1 apolipoprotein N-acyltransferase [Geothermobacter hydrogeniphilus]
MVLRFPRRDTLCALASGLVSAFAFPRPSWFVFAWFGLLPLLLTGERRPFRNGWLAGCGFFALVLYWLNIVMTTYGRLEPLLSLAAYLLLVTYLSLYWGLAWWGSCKLRERLGLPHVFSLPLLWTGLEYLRGHLLSGFPWALLGYSQQPFTTLLQSADLFGVYGLSFLLVLANASLAGLVRAGKGERRKPLFAAGLTAVLVIAALCYGGWRLDQRPVAGKPLTIGLAQGNIDQAVKWDPAFRQWTLRTYRELTARAAAAGADLVIWPESAVPFYFQEPGQEQREVLQVAGRLKGFLLFGSPAYLRQEGKVRYLNSAYLLNADGRQLGRSDKVHLVPFGEYVPLKWLFPFIDKLVVGIGDFSPGRVEPLVMNGHRLGVLVCYEAIFPELARDYVNSGSDLLVNITNDAWFGRSSAPWQLLEMSAVRAVENRIWIARAANTGISALISPLGEIRQQTPLFKPALLVGKVYPGAGASLYRRIGDLLPQGCLLVAVLLGFAARLRPCRRFRGQLSGE